MRRLADEGRFDYLIVESSGISEPMPVAATFSFPDEDGRALGELAPLDTMVTVVDAANLLAQLRDGASLESRGLDAYEDDDRTIADLLVDQIEFADVLVVNKTDLVTAAELDTVEAVLTRLNPQARRVRSLFRKIPVAEVLHTGLFDLERAETAPGWVRELNGTHIPETIEYGINSLVFRAAAPFHHERFWDLVAEEIAAGEAAWRRLPDPFPAWDLAM